MTTAKCERPGRRNEPGLPPEETYPHHQVNPPPILPGCARGYTADARWRSNFERMAKRAESDSDFYAIAGGNVQHRADQIKRGQP